MLILKLGGAAITDKAVPNTLRLEVLRQVAKTLANHPQPMILIHGAGSFGHILAKEYQLQNGLQDNAQKRALVKLQQQLHSLNQQVVEVLVEAGLPVFPLHPASMCLMHHRRIAAFFLESVTRALELDLLPVLYGDCVWDTAQGFSILSGDQIAVYLAEHLPNARLAFGTNVNGVLDAQGQVIPEFHLSAITQVGKSAATDVTGGMLGKLQEIAELKNPTIPTQIFNLLNQHHLERVLVGETHIGTRLVSNQD